LDIGVLGYIGIVWPKEHSPEVRSFPPGTPCIYMSHNTADGKWVPEFFPESEAAGFWR